MTRINGINFSVDEPGEYYAEAREEAMADAKMKAEQLAKLANVSLGDVTFISENSYYAPVAKSAMAVGYDEAAGFSTSISPGELDISLSLQVTYAIK